ncbi:protein BatD [Tenacibaculum sp. AHE15PA]|uniref:BatD family protein n=1 Tax=unclassified Tenacibaculum TaxID=2635139 RepID=UPI001C4EFEE4|nr:MULTISPECIES: BatD family protein [unclassified Tenacibaculum]QXP73351.1 protein BatD [Tenacibaculum sp. AHE14PA]QXP74865.1 protein BatD [Tenacibaculum sp. AHE15PA]
MKLKIYTSLLLLFITLTINAQESALKATVSKNKLGVNQRLRVEFSTNKQGADNFKAPNFKNFKIVGGPSQSVSQSWINGKVTFSKSYTYIIQPKRKGEFNIPPATIEIGGEIIKSNTVKVIVLGAVDIPKNPNDPNYIAQQNIHLVAELSKSQPYVGESVYVEYRLYFSDNVGIYDNAITEAPQYNGFWNQEIKRNGTPVKTGMYNGERYRYAVLHKALLVPTKNGRLTIDPMKMDIIVAVPTGRADFFGNVITKQVRREFSSAKKVVRAKALPLNNKPENFTGAVGDFSFDVSLNKGSLKANESSLIKVEVNGKGNLKLFELPKIETPEELEIYQPERKERISVTSSGISGSVSDTYTVVPEFKGKYKIPKTSFSYFDPKEKTYKTIVTDDLYVDVLEGKPLPKNQSDIVIKQDVKITGDDFKYLQTTTSFEPVKTTIFFNSILFYILLFLPIISIPVAIFINKKKEERDVDIVGNKKRKADRLAKKYLSEAQKELGNKEAFYEALERALHNYLKAKLGIETLDISTEKITFLLQDKKIENTTITNFIDVLNDCDFARYTPITNLQMEQEYEKAKEIITQLDKQL